MKYFLLKLILTIVLCCIAAGLHAEPPSKYQVKAAYIYNFAKFIKWPESAFSDTTAPLIIGVLGQNPFAGKLKPLNSKLVRQRPIEIKYFETLEEVRSCQLLYIDTSEPGELESILTKLKIKPVITIGENKDFASRGGVIQFVTVRGRLRFIINLDIAKSNKVQIDAQLLSLATKVLGAK